jgi:CPA1 family monovalent cation:H+ antiporter
MHGMADTILAAALLLVLAVVIAGALRRLTLPDSVVLVLAGMGLAELARHWPAVALLAELHLSPDLVFFVLLPALVFESGLNLDTRRLLKNLAPIVALAVPALVLSTAAIGVGLWWLSGMDLLVALLFGALISATDPVAVVALFREVGAPARLGVLVEGESLFNDATAIVVFGLLLAILLAGGQAATEDLLLALPRFAVVFLGGLLLGVGLGALASELTWRLHSATPAVLAMSVAAAYLSFVLGEHVAHVSGVMAAVGAAITMGALGVTRLDRDTHQAQADAWELLAFVCNALLFLLVGMAVDVASLLQRWPLILAAVLLVHAARALAVYGLVPLTTRLFRLPRVTLPERHIMWWGGLKGGLAVAMVLSVPESLPQRQLLLDVTVGVVLVTLLVNASTLRALMHWLKLDRMSGTERAELVEAVHQARRRIGARLDAFRGAGVMPADTHHRLLHGLMATLEPAVAEEGRSRALAAHLGALQAEAGALLDLHECRAIDQYTFLELRDLLVRDREATEHDDQGLDGSGNLFRRLEGLLLSWLRERDWASGVLSRYQQVRLYEHFQHSLAGAVMASAALVSLDQQDETDDDALGELRRRYRDRRARRQARLRDLREEFPTFFQALSERTFRRAALLGALHRAEHDSHHGQLGAKASAELGRLVHAALAREAEAKGDDAPSAQALVAGVPLFQGLSADSIEALAAEARPVTFLPGDVVIGQGDRGDALYIVSRGRVRVTRDGDAAPLAELGDGEFFGEAALLGDPVRNATVTATLPSTLLRMTRTQALADTT